MSSVSTVCILKIKFNNRKCGVPTSYLKARNSFIEENIHKLQPKEHEETGHADTCSQTQNSIRGNVFTLRSGTCFGDHSRERQLKMGDEWQESSERWDDRDHRRLNGQLIFLIMQSPWDVWNGWWILLDILIWKNLWVITWKHDDSEDLLVLSRQEMLRIKIWVFPKRKGRIGHRRQKIVISPSQFSISHATKRIMVNFCLITGWET